jgi:bla regulator protein blaR1
MNLLKDIIPQEYIQALGWTLLHSIWQAGLIALLLGLLLVVIQRSASIRYWAAASALPLVLLTALLTFYLNLESATQTSDEKLLSVRQELFIEPAGSGEESSLTALEDDVKPVSLVVQFKAYFTSHFPLIITLWFIGIIILTLKFLGGLAYVQRLKNYKAIDITFQWEEKLKSISNKIGLNKTVRILESSLVAVPMVVGYVKPVILLPIGAIAGLSSSQVEAILAHELAHILRKDYLVNIFQTIIEILFFYHPVIWWISARVREERENCCDDIALQVNENSLVYAKALSTLGEMQVQTPQMAMAATSKSKNLYKRIKRMLTKSTQHPTFSEGFITACALFICIFAFSMVARASLISNSTDVSVSKISEVVSIDDGEFEAVALNIKSVSGEDNDLIIVKNKKGKIVELYINGRKVPRNEIQNYSAMIEESLAQQQDQQSIGGKINEADEQALKRMMEDLKEEQRYLAEKEAEDLRREIEELKREQQMRNKANQKNGDNKNQNLSSSKAPGEVINSFVQKTIEISKLGLKIGSLSLELESLKNKLENPDLNTSKNRAEVKRLEKEIAELERKVGIMEKEIEASGEEIGRLSLDLATSALDSIDFSNMDFGDIFKERNKKEDPNK